MFLSPRIFFFESYYFIVLYFLVERFTWSQLMTEEIRWFECWGVRTNEMVLRYFRFSNDTWNSWWKRNYREWRRKEWWETRFHLRLVLFVYLKLYLQDTCLHGTTNVHHSSTSWSSDDESTVRGGNFQTSASSVTLFWKVNIYIKINIGYLLNLIVLNRNSDSLNIYENAVYCDYLSRIWRFVHNRRQEFQFPFQTK